MKDHELQRSLGDAMGNFRQTLELSQESFADSIGMHRAYYSALERGKKNPTVATLGRVAAGLRVTLAELFTAAESQRP